MRNGRCLLEKINFILTVILCFCFCLPARRDLPLRPVMDMKRIHVRILEYHSRRHVTRVAVRVIEHTVWLIYRSMMFLGLAAGGNDRQQKTVNERKHLLFHFVLKEIEIELCRVILPRYKEAMQLWFLSGITITLLVTVEVTVHAFAMASPSNSPPPSLSVPVWSLASPLSSTILLELERTGTSSDDGDDQEKPAQQIKNCAATMTTTTSMNIITFATPVSVAPPKLWAVSLYTNTLTKRAFEESKVGILQLLTPKQSKLVPVLGKRSGYERSYSKRGESDKLGYPWTRTTVSVPGDSDSDPTKETDSSHSSSESFNLVNVDVLPGCATYILIKFGSSHRAGDHDVALCQVIGTGEWDAATNELVFHESDRPPLLPMDHSEVLYTGHLRQEGII
jgi:flavin reductase (DIM6/NTAB) family NADH-FMN oxidoreductase RutF